MKNIGNRGFKKWIIFILVFVPLILLTLKWGTDRIKLNRKNAELSANRSESLRQKELLDASIEDILKAEFITDDRDTLTVETDVTHNTLKSGEWLYFWNYRVVLTYNSFEGFNNLSPQAQYESLVGIRNGIYNSWYRIRSEYDMILPDISAMKEKTGFCVSPFFTVSIRVNCDGESYYYFDWELRKNSEIIYTDKGAPTEDSVNRPPQRPANGGNGTVIETYNELTTDPDDYDDPDDYAEDAWGVDFDDYDEAYEFWENW